jgi:tetratricopeptide (TPR) repeat protein
MPQIDLKQYADEVARKIEERQLDAAIDHCRHILGFYPRYLPVYRLLASASLEKGDYAHAAHFLQSLLSADPERADAWADLATLSDDLGELEQATWLMERAFEIEPGNAEIRERLRSLYKRRDGIDRPRLKLTPGALGRMYAVGGFHRRAIHELQRLLESRAGLPPLHVAFLEVALAKAFWNADDMEAMAEGVCQSLLGKLPNCLQANLVMGQILWSRGQAEEAESYLAVARALDPEGWAAQDLFGDQSPIPFEHIQIPHLEPGKEVTIIEQPSVAAVPVEDTSWLDDVGEAFEARIDLTAPSEPEAESRTPGWLEEWSAAEVPPAAEADSAPVPPADREQVGQTAPLPAWMTDLEPEGGQGAAEERELPAWLEESDTIQDQPTDVTIEEAGPSAVPVGEGAQEEEEEEAAELPAWLEELASEAEPAQELEAVSEEEPRSLVPPVQPEAAVEGEAEILEEPAGELSADELPDWLRAFGEEEIEETVEIETAAPPSQTFDEELPDWMQTSVSGTEEPGSEDEAQGNELPDWLRALGDTEQELADLTFVEEESAEVVPSPTLDEEELPDWLRELRAQQPDVEEEEQGALDWMTEAEEEPESEIEAIEEDELPDWLRELRGQEPVDEPLPVEDGTPEVEPDAEAPRAAETSAEIQSLRDEELPEWLQALRAQEAVPADEPSKQEELPVEGELPGWLDEIEVEAGPETPVETLGEEELPDWLRELRAQEPTLGDQIEEQALTGPTAEETPDWLAEIQAEENVELPVEAIDEEELPDWLRELRAQEPGFLPAAEEAESTAATADEAEVPGWPFEGEPESEAEPATEFSAEQTVEEDLPDWLRNVQPEEGQPQTAAPEPPTLAPTGGPRPPVEMPEPVPGMPAWLSELEAEIASQPAPETQVELPTTIGEVAAAPQEGIGETGEEGTEAPEIKAVAEPEAELLETAEETTPVETTPSVAVSEEPQAEPPEVTEETAYGQAMPSREAVEEPGEVAARVEAEALAEEAIEAQEAEAVAETPAWIEAGAEPLVEAEEIAPVEAVPPVEAVEEPGEVVAEAEALLAEEATEAQQAEIVAEVAAVADTEPQPEVEEPELAAPPTVELPAEAELPALQTAEPSSAPSEVVYEGDLQADVGEEPDWVRELEAPPAPPELEASAEAADLVQVEEAVSAPLAEAADESEVAPAPAGIIEPTERLTQARSHLEEGALDRAADEYEQLIDTSSLQPELLQDLEQAVAAHPDHAALQRVLGDVYMRVGQLQKALQAYRQALGKLS